VLTDFKINIQ